jgi:hypothetical protein
MNERFRYLTPDLHARSGYSPDLRSSPNYISSIGKRSPNGSLISSEAASRGSPSGNNVRLNIKANRSSNDIGKIRSVRDRSLESSALDIASLRTPKESPKIRKSILDRVGPVPEITRALTSQVNRSLFLDRQRDIKVESSPFVLNLEQSV